MAFPVIESVTETTFASDTTAHVVSMPASVNAGDALIVIFTNDGSATVTTPSGWTQLYTLANGTALTGGAYAKVASGSEGGGTVDFVTSATESASAQCYRISGWHGLITGVEAGTAGSITTGTTADPPSLSPSWGALDTLWLATCHTSTTQTISSGPTSYTNLTQTSSGSGTTFAQTISARRSNNTATEDPGVFTTSGTGASKVYNTLAIRPLTSGGLAATESSSDSFSGSGDVAVQGGLAATETGGDSFSSTGSVLISGSLSANESGADTFAASGGPVISGDLSASESGGDTFAASGVVVSAAVTGSMAAMESGSDVFKGIPKLSNVYLDLSLATTTIDVAYTIQNIGLSKSNPIISLSK